ncbi:unnamed protein product [Lymnaea stagnalis]|uniref:Uncharacterized protein n=1 Tax=Lymnaea stagnalis TaxID=6523 RepID=A0AAV2IMA9_LYMST
MVRAWYMDDSDSDKREPHMLDPPVFLSFEELNKKTGVDYFKFDADTWELNNELAELRKKKGTLSKMSVKFQKTLYQITTTS